MTYGSTFQTQDEYVLLSRIIFYKCQFSNYNFSYNKFLHLNNICSCSLSPAFNYFAFPCRIWSFDWIKITMPVFRKSTFLFACSYYTKKLLHYVLWQQIFLWRVFGSIGSWKYFTFVYLIETMSNVVNRWTVIIGCVLFFIYVTYYLIAAPSKEVVWWVNEPANLNRSSYDLTVKL